jgi:hypothetical protein
MLTTFRRSDKVGSSDDRQAFSATAGSRDPSHGWGGLIKPEY